ncbi:MAG TPA: hypothetical protein VIL78_15765 [Hanamia sp.]
MTVKKDPMDNGMRQADSCEISNKSNKAETINPAYRAGGRGHRLIYLYENNTRS